MVGDTPSLFPLYCSAFPFFDDYREKEALLLSRRRTQRCIDSLSVAGRTPFSCLVLRRDRHWERYKKKKVIILKCEKKKDKPQTPSFTPSNTYPHWCEYDTK
jgi:hypothetical protein